MSRLSDSSRSGGITALSSGVLVLFPELHLASLQRVEVLLQTDGCL